MSVVEILDLGYKVTFHNLRIGGIQEDGIFNEHNKLEHCVTQKKSKTQ